jgi:hypothetical protein
MVLRKEGAFTTQARASLRGFVVRARGAPQIPPLRYAPVGMTNLLGGRGDKQCLSALSSSRNYGLSLVKTWSLEMSLNITNAAKISRTTKAAW